MMLDRTQGLFESYFAAALVGVLPQLSIPVLGGTRDPMGGYAIQFPSKGSTLNNGETYATVNPSKEGPTLDYSTNSWPSGGYKSPFMLPTFQVGLGLGLELRKKVPSCCPHSR